MDIRAVIKSLSQKRTIFHSEADFQFALAWEIQLLYINAKIILEYSPSYDQNKSIDIVVSIDKYKYPIELKYKTKKFSTNEFKVKNHGAQDIGKYDCIKDVCRIEDFSNNISDFKIGYVIFLTNDQSYWNEPKFKNAGYAAFTVHDGAVKSGTMKWGENMSAGSTKGRTDELILKNKYIIKWSEYSDFKREDGVFKYALIEVSDCFRSLKK
jgi:hypothetical protein